MSGLTFTRKISAGQKTIKIWVPAENVSCPEDCEHVADEQAMLASTLADQDDDCWYLAHKLVMQLGCVQRVEVVDNETGDGAEFQAIYTDD